MPAKPKNVCEKAISRVTHRVIFADTDAMGIVYYGNYFNYFEIGRSEWFREHMRPSNDYIRENSFFIVLDAACKYLRPATYDELLTIETTVGRADRVKVRMDYRIYNAKEELLVEGHTTHTVVDEVGKIKRMTKEFVEQMKARAGGA